MTDERRRPNGSGTIEELPDGRFRVRVFLDGKRVTLPGGPWDTREIAEGMLAAWQLSRGNGSFTAPTELTLGALGREWLDGRELGGSERREVVRSIRVERSIWSRHVAESDLAGLPLTKVGTPEVRAFARWLRARRCVSAIRTRDGVKLRDTSRTLSRSMQTHALRLVRAVLDVAVERELLARNPAHGVSVAVGARAPRDLSEDWLREDELGRLLACPALDLRDRTAYAVALGLALRLDDIKAIEVAHVELDARVPGPAVRVWIAKSQKWHRVPVLPWLAPWLRAHLATLPKGARYLFPAPDTKDTRVRGQARYGVSYDFGWAAKRERALVGRGKKRAVVDRTHPSALEIAGVKRKIRFHDLRGSTATHLALGTWGRRWALHEVQAMLAHSDSRVTERYVRRATDTLADAARDTPGCPRLPMTGTDGTQNRPVFPDAPGGIRTCDLSLRKGKRGRGTARGYERRGQRMGNEVALEVLAMAARGRIPGSLLDEFADVVLGRADVQLAQAIAKGGRHVARVAIELAEMVLADGVQKRSATR